MSTGRLRRKGERGTGDRPGRTASGQVGAPAAAVSGTPVQPVCSDRGSMRENRAEPTLTSPP